MEDNLHHKGAEPARIIHNPNLPRDIEVEITFLSAEQGGRKSAAPNGYRPQFFYDGHDWDAMHSYPETDWVAPGQTVRAFLTFLSPQEHVGKLQPGKTFQIREGQKVVANGVVLRILDLGKSAARMSKEQP